MLLPETLEDVCDEFCKTIKISQIVPTRQHSAITSSMVISACHTLAAESVAARQEQYRCFLENKLRPNIEASQEVMRGVVSAMESLDALLESFRTVSSSTLQLRGDIEHITQQKEELRHFADAAEANLHYFQELESLKLQLSSGSVTAQRPNEFSAMLSRLDAAITFMTTHAHYRSVSLHLTVLRQLQNRVLAMARDQVITSLRSSTTKALADFRTVSVNPQATPSTFVKETASLYVAFRAMVPEIRVLISHIERRCDFRGHLPLLTDCLQGYVSSRRTVLQRITQGTLLRLTGEADDIVRAIRTGCIHFLRLCRDEAALFACFFTTAGTNTSPGAAPSAPPSPWLSSRPPTPPSIRMGADNSDAVSSAPASPTIWPATASVMTTPGTAVPDSARSRRDSSASPAEAGVPADACRYASQALSDFLLEVMASLHHFLRPLIIQIKDVDTLCELVDALQGEVAAAIASGSRPQQAGGDTAEASPPPDSERLSLRLAPLTGRGHQRVTDAAVLAYVKCLHAVLHDAQERLVFRSEVFIRDEIRGFLPLPEHLDYPALIVRNEAASRPSLEAMPPPPSPSQSSQPLPQSSCPPSSSATPVPEKWYPTLHRTLAFLAKAHRALETSVFEGLAHDAVLSCLASLVNAAKLITKFKGSVDGQLFLMMHLVMLREQLVPFERPFTVAETSLDFTPLSGLIVWFGHALTSVPHSDAWNRVKQDRFRSFVTNPSGSILTLVARASPRLMVVAHDSRQDLERELKYYGRAFIASATRICLEPLAPFLTPAAKASLPGAPLAAATWPPPSSGGKGEQPASGAVLFTPTMAATARRSEVSLRSQITLRLRQIAEKLSIYLRGVEMYEELLLQPVQTSVDSVLQRFDAFLAEYALPSPSANPPSPPTDLPLTDADNAPSAHEAVSRAAEPVLQF